ncbi:unnamed protein product, partial [Sphenostylis stenocarpa]
ECSKIQDSKLPNFLPMVQLLLAYNIQLGAGEAWNDNDGIIPQSLSGIIPPNL